MRQGTLTKSILALQISAREEYLFEFKVSSLWILKYELIFVYSERCRQSTPPHLRFNREKEDVMSRYNYKNILKKWKIYFDFWNHPQKTKCSERQAYRPRHSRRRFPKQVSLPSSEHCRKQSSGGARTPQQQAGAQPLPSFWSFSSGDVTLRSEIQHQIYPNPRKGERKIAKQILRCKHSC